MSLSTEQKLKYYNILKSSENQNVVMLRLFEAVTADVDEMVGKTNIDNQDLKEELYAIIDDFEARTDTTNKAILKSITIGLSDMKALKKKYSTDMAKSNAVIAERLNQIVTDIEKMRGPEGKQGVKGDPGKDGETPTEEELLSLIQPLIPKPEKKKEITGDKLVEKVNKSKKKIKMSQIEGLEERKISQRGGGSGGGMGNAVTEAFVCDGATASFTLASRVATSGKAIMVFYQGQALETTTHFSVSGKNLALTFTPDNGTVIFVWYIRA